MAEESREFWEIESVRGDALWLPFADGGVRLRDVLALHAPLSRRDLRPSARARWRASPRRRVYVIDLHRHPVAYYFYTTVGRLLLHNRLVREDGALSILRSFRPRELHVLAERAGLTDMKVERRFPYRLVLSARV